MAVCIHYGRLRIANGPLKGRHYAGGHGEFVFLDDETRTAYIYSAVSPPHRRLRTRAAYFTDWISGPLSKRQMRLLKETNVTWSEA